MSNEGAPSQISAITQTSDGYLWIGSSRGLFRFDGVQFELYEPPAAVAVPSHNIYALLASAEGGLWISYRPWGLGYLKDGTLTVYKSPEQLPKTWVYCFAQDKDGRVWAGTHAGLALREGSRWIEIGADWNFKRERVTTMFVDRAGTLWVATERTIVYLERGSRTFRQTGAKVRSVSRITQAPDGRIWMAELTRSARPVPGQTADARGYYPEIEVDANDVMFDRDGTLWVTCSKGITRVRSPEHLGGRKLRLGDPALESFRQSDGLSDDPVHNLFEDREGNIWVNSGKGLDRFRYSYFVPVSLPPGHQYSTLVAGDRGSILAASPTEPEMSVVLNGTVQSEKTPLQVSSRYKGADGTIWWGGLGGLWKMAEGRSEFFRQPAFTEPDYIWEVFPDRVSGGLWLGLGDYGVVSFKDGVWAGLERPAGMRKKVPSASFQDGKDREWLGYNDDRVSLIDHGKVVTYTRSDGLQIGRIKVIRGKGSEFWFGGELGLAVFSKGRFRSILGADGQPFGSVSGIVVTSDGTLWLNELRGVVRISGAEARRAVEDQAHLVTYDLFDLLDGLPGGMQMNYTVSTAVKGSDGKIWFATDNGLAWIDPVHLSRNRFPPPVAIRSLQSGEKTFEPSEEVALPTGSNNLTIDYTALSLSIPERVRFRYKLDGVDRDWQDVGTRRKAYYTNLGPGDYTFRVTASNNDGVWNQNGASLEFSIAPAFYQTNVFIFLCLAAACATIIAAYRWRVHRVKALLNLKFQERLAERSVIARELHDTLLQEVYSVSVGLDAIVRSLDEGTSVKGGLQRIQHQTRRMMTDGRNTLNVLHGQGTHEAIDLEELFANVPEDLDLGRGVDFTVGTSGTRRALHPVVRQVVFRIGRESVINAFRHSGAGKIEVLIEYSRKNLNLIVKDDGRGMSDALQRYGKAGHYGIAGMRDFADGIGAKLRIRSQSGEGTQVELTVPARIAFENPRRGGYIAPLTKLFRSRSKKSGGSPGRKE